MNSAANLGLEATYINRNFSQMAVLDSQKYSLPNSNPFYDSSSTEPDSSVMFRYRKWSLGTDMTLIARTQVDAAISTSGSGNPISVSTVLKPKSSDNPAAETQFVTIRALTEFDTKITNTPDWRVKLDSQRGAVIATEIKNNANKLSRWTMESILSGAEWMRVG